MAVDDRVADCIELAAPRRLRGVGALLALVESGIARGILVRLIGAEPVKPPMFRAKAL